MGPTCTACNAHPSPALHAYTVQMYMDGLRLYCSPWFRGASLLHVTLDTSGPLVGGGGGVGGSSSNSTAHQGGAGAVHYSPSLTSLAARLAESVQLAVAEVNGLRGIRVRGRRGGRNSWGGEAWSIVHITAPLCKPL